MFTPNDFRLPSGEEMTPEEIADMLNNWKNVPVKTQVELGAHLPYVGDVSFTRRVRQFGVPPGEYPALEIITAPRRSGVFQLINDKVNSQYLMEGREAPPYIVLGYNLVYSLQYDTPENLRSVEGRTIPTAINTAVGPVELVISSVIDRIEFGFKKAYQAY